jgi:hypothetical protein
MIPIIPMFKKEIQWKGAAREFDVVISIINV